MAISTYSELKSAITDWMDRSDLTGDAADFITLAEARLNRKLEAAQTDVELTGTAGSRSIDISAYSVIEPIALWLLDNGEEYRLTYKAEGTFPQTTDSDEPQIWTVDGDNIDFDCKLDQAYTFRFRYRGRFALSDAAPTNDLLTNHPDVYLAASILWGGIYIKDPETAVGFKALLDEFLPETKTYLADTRRGTLTVDPTLARMRANRRGYYDGD